jgi:hypothetical protein
MSQWHSDDIRCAAKRYQGCLKEMSADFMASLDF